MASKRIPLTAYHRESMAVEAVVIAAVQRQFGLLWTTLDLTGGVEAALGAIRQRSRVLKLPVPSGLGRVMAAGMFQGDLMGRWHCLRGALPAEVVFSDLPDVLEPGTWRTPVLVDRAVRFLFDKELMNRGEFNALKDRYRSAGFTIAGEHERAFLAIAKASLEGSLRRKLTVDQAADAMQRALRRKGYDPLRPWHARIVAQMNYASAYGAASWEQLNDPRIAGIIPAFKYLTAHDERVRKTHAEMHGYVAARGAQIWRVWWPPNDWGCRCFVIGVNHADWVARGEKSMRWPRLDGRAIYPGARDGISFAGNPSQYIRRKAAAA